MSINMMEILNGQLGGMIAGQIGKAVGLDSKQAESGIGALLPTILGGLMKQSSTPEGASQLDEALSSDDYDGGMLDNLSGMFSGDTSNVSNLGGGLVSMILGDKAGAITNIIGQVTGMKSGSASGLLGLLLPLVMSFLGKQKREQGLDSHGIASLLMSQKDEVAKALPQGMVGALGLGDLGFDDTPASAPVGVSSSAAPASCDTKSGECCPGGGLAKLLIPLAVIAAIGIGAYKFLGGGGVDVPDVTVPDVSLPSIDVGSVEDAVSGAADKLGMSADDVTGKLKDVFGGYEETLSGITDVDSAKAALPKMEGLNEQLGGIGGMLDKLPAGVKESVGGGLGSMIDPIKAMLDKVLAIPGVGPILKPVVDSMLEKVGVLTGGA